MSERERRYGRLIDRSKGTYRNFTLSGKRTKEFQIRTLRRILTKAKNTQFGLQYDYQGILYSGNIYEQFKNNVPLSDYALMLPWWEKVREGTPDVTWPGLIKHFALSSGTSDGTSKYIPVSAEMVKAIRRASMRQILSIARTDMPKDHMTKHWLMIGGSTSLNYNGIYYAGDLSGITTSKIPPLFQRVSKPEPEIKASDDWQEKINRITNEAMSWDVSMVAGVPAWVQLLFKNIIEHYEVENIHDIWPNLEVYIHGGVSIKPYQEGINSLLGKPIKYFETYLASEGFIAFQNREESNGGMRLLIRNGIFYEFVPFNSSNFDENHQLKPDAQALPIWEVEEEQEYALLLSTCSGAWRYLVGDTIKFVNLKRKEIIITGRTTHFISLVGEHLSIDNMTEAVYQLAKMVKSTFTEFTVSGIKKDGGLGHKWYLGTDNTRLVGQDLSGQLDTNLRSLNDDYSIERDHALKHMEVVVIPIAWFLEWMEKNDKEGSQHKFPRVMKGKTFENWQQFLEKKGINRSESAY